METEEHHYLDLEVTTTSIGQVVTGSELDPGVDCLNAPVQGTGNSNRHGQECYFTHLSIHGHVLFEAKADGSSPSVPGYVRILVILDKQTNATTFNAEDVLIEPSNSSLGAEAMHDPENEARFDILYDGIVEQKIYSGAGSSSSSDWSAQQRPFRIDMPLALTTTYSGSLGTVANVIDNSLHVMAIYQGSTQASVGYISRVRYFS